MNAIISAAARPTAARDVSLGLNGARDAQAAWTSAGLAARLRVLQRFRALLADGAWELARIVESTTGRPPVETLTAEILPLADGCRFLERRAARLLRPKRLGISGRPLWLVGARTEVRREPLGVVLIIAPSNYPLFLAGAQALQALAAGNAVLLKPAMGSSAVAERFAALLAAAGADSRLIRVLPESIESAHQIIALGVDKVFLTGSAQTGADVLWRLASELTPAVMELSGCDAAFVRRDADLDLVVRSLTFSLRLKDGRTCIAPRRVLAARECAAELENRLKYAVREIGPIVVAPREAAPAAWLAAEAVRRGARLVAGQINADGGIVGPLIVGDAKPDMALLRQEVMAPLLSIVAAADDDDALAADASCPYALGATVFGKEPAASRLAHRVRAGVVVVNDVIVPTADPRIPFGGRGRSGFGVTRGAEGLLEMTVPKVVCAARRLAASPRTPGASRRIAVPRVHSRRSWRARRLSKALVESGARDRAAARGLRAIDEVERGR